MKTIGFTGKYIAFTIKFFFIFIFFIFLTTFLQAQSPEKMSYQAVVRDASDDLVISSTVGMKVSILQGSAGGTAVYVETHTPATNADGLVTIEIGAGTVVSGDFSAIDWSAGPYFLKTETDPAGGTNYTITGTSQLLSVPYALYAKTAENFTETDPVFGASVAGGITGADTANWNNKLDAEVDGSVTNEIQTISRIGLTVTLTDGGSFTDSVNVFDGDMQYQKIRNLADPDNGQDAATKAYVDALINQLYEAGALTVRDKSGNTYNTIKIGDQLWLAENLKTTRYNDGDSIPLVTDNTEWSNLTTPGYCWYDNDEMTYGYFYGALYNWYAVNTGKLCPTGWHVPTDDEWTTLVNYLGGESVAGGKMKETGTVHWSSPNTGATNESGFTALPGGYRGDLAAFRNIGTHADWWYSTQSGTTDAWSRSLSYDVVNSYRNLRDMKYGFSVRCLKD